MLKNNIRQEWIKLSMLLDKTVDRHKKELEEIEGEIKKLQDKCPHYDKQYCYGQPEDEDYYMCLNCFKQIYD